MSSFTAPLIVEKLGLRRWKTHRGFRYCVGSLDSDWRIDVPAGFETDFASIPRALWWLLPPDGAYTQAAVLHDWLCKERKYTRLRTSSIFHEAMQVLGVGRFTARAMFLAVQWFGPEW